MGRSRGNLSWGHSWLLMSGLWTKQLPDLISNTLLPTGWKYCNLVTSSMLGGHLKLRERSDELLHLVFGLKVCGKKDETHKSASQSILTWRRWGNRHRDRGLMEMRIPRASLHPTNILSRVFCAGGQNTQLTSNDLQGEKRIIKTMICLIFTSKNELNGLAD